MISVAVFTYNPFQENTYVLYDQTKECVIIDPGCYEKSENEQLFDFVMTNNLKVVKLVNTHCHIDHMLGNKFVVEAFNVDLYAHKLETEVLSSVYAYGPSMGIFPEQSPQISNFIEEGDLLEFGDSKLQTLFCPGHSPGSICFYSAENKFLIGGDVLFQLSIGRTDLPGGDHQTLINSLNDKVMKLPEDTIVYPGHGQSTNIGFEKANNPFLN